MENTQTKDTGGYGEKICEPCDDCYNLIENAANNHRQNLEELQRLLQKIADNPNPIGESFEFELKALQVDVTSTLADAKIEAQNGEGGTLRERLENLRVKLMAVINLVISADNNVKDAEEKGYDASFDVNKAKEVVERAKDALKLSQKLLETEGRDALRKAQDRSKKFGEENAKMSAIAREARIMAEQ